MKFNGIIHEIFENPNTNIVELLQDKLHLPPDKAEILADRIEKHYLKTPPDVAKNFPIKLVTEKLVDNTKQSSQPKQRDVYALESLSSKEFEVFTKWFLQELDYNVYPDSVPAFLGADYLATKNDLKTVFLARKYSTSYIVLETAVLLAHQAKHNYQCENAIILTTTLFSDAAKIHATKYGVELWDIQILNEKILEIKQITALETHNVFPTYKGTLLDSLLALAEDKKFLIEKRVGGKYDVFFPGVSFPLLTFQVQNSQVTRLVYRIKYNEPVGENDGEALINCSRNDNTSNRPNDADAYAQVIAYLEQFLE